MVANSIQAFPMGHAHAPSQRKIDNICFLSGNSVFFLSSLNSTRGATSFYVACFPDVCSAHLDLFITVLDSCFRSRDLRIRFSF